MTEVPGMLTGQLLHQEAKKPTQKEEIVHHLCTRVRRCPRLKIVAVIWYYTLPLGPAKAPARNMTFTPSTFKRKCFTAFLQDMQRMKLCLHTGKLTLSFFSLKIKRKDPDLHPGDLGSQGSVLSNYIFSCNLFISKQGIFLHELVVGTKHWTNDPCLQVVRVIYMWLHSSLGIPLWFLSRTERPD